MALSRTDALHLRHARAHLRLLRELEQLASRRGEGTLDVALDSALQQLDLDWSNFLKAHLWCSSHAQEVDEAAKLCGEFASTAPDLLSLRLSPTAWLAWLQTGLDVSPQTGDDLLRRKLLENLGHASLKGGDLAKARSCFEEQLTLATRQGDRLSAGRALCSLANVASLLGEYTDAERLFERALGAAKEIRNEPLEADVLGNLAILYDDVGRPSEAGNAYRQALETARRIGDRAGESRHIGNLAGLHKHIGDSEEALGLYREQLGVARDLKDAKGQAAALHNLGLLHLDQGQMESASDAFEESLQIRRRIGDRPGEGKELGALGLVARRKGDRLVAFEHFTRWLQIARDSGNRLEEAEALSSLGNSSATLEASRSYYEGSLKIARELGHPRGVAIVLNNLARLSDLEGDTTQAQQLNAEALLNHQRAGNRIGEARSLWHMAKIAFRINKVSEAFSYGYQALDVYCTLRHRDWTLDLVYLLGDWALEVGDEGLLKDYESRVARALEGFPDAKTAW